MMDEIIYIYDETTNPDGAAFHGVPLRDLTADDVAGFGPMQQRQVDAAPWYVPFVPDEEE